MDEERWLNTEVLHELVNHLHSENAHRKKVGRRKFRLYCCACARRLWDHLDAHAQALIEAIELHLDGRLTDEVLKVRYQELMAQYYQTASQTSQPRMMGYGVVWSAASTRYPNYMAMQAAGNVASSEVYRLRSERQLAGDAPDVIQAAALQCQAREMRLQTDLLREIFGNPFRPMPKRKWSADIRGLAQACYEDASNYPMLADALEDAGQEEAARHCRQTGHVKGCHVVDWILGKA